MNFKKHTIFGEKKEQEEKDVNKILIKKNKKGDWYFNKKGNIYNMSPPEIAKNSFSPIVAGADRLIKAGCSLKNIDYKNGIYLYFSEQEFINCDIRIEFDEKLFNGWLYNVYSEKIKVDNGQKVWACSYLKLYYDNPPRKIYLKLESN